MIKKLAATGVLGVAVTASVLASAPAYAAAYGDPASDNMTSGNASILGGNQVNLPISVPINACGNAVAVIGLAGAQCKGGATVK